MAGAGGGVVKLGHYLDRVVLTAHPQATDIHLMTLLAALSLTYNTLEQERVALLHDLTVRLRGLPRTPLQGLRAEGETASWSDVTPWHCLVLS